MDRLPQIVPISELRQRQQELLLALDSGPVVFTQHGKAAAVMISPEQWNQIVDDLEDYVDLVNAMRQDQAVAQGEAEWVDVDLDELRSSQDDDKLAA